MILCLLCACTAETRTGDGGNGGAAGSAPTSRTGGTAGGGGAAGSGGAAGLGGSSTSSGTTGPGGTTGGASGTGGAFGTGGGSASDGGPGAGGTAGGGVTGTGGRTGAGGSATSGRSGAGGRTGGGGATGTGGASGAGGTAATGGGTSTGGRSGNGGANATGGATAIGGATGAGGATHAGKWQIMPLGDSITGTTCYPKLLAKKLNDNGHTNFSFVGTVLNNQGCGSAPDVQTEGHGGYLVTYLTTNSPPQGDKGTLAELETWAAEQPDVVLMEYGTNDAWSSIATSSIISAFGFVVDRFRAQNANVIFFVAQITPLNPTGCPSCEANVEALNAKIPAWASGKSTAASPIYIVDVWSSLQPASSYTPNSTYTGDGCHPNQAGSQKMADKWYEGLLAAGIP